MTATTEGLQRLGEELWVARLHSLLKPDQAGAHLLAFDLNADGIVTISDAILWLQWLFWLPGDYAIIALMRWAPAAASFLEISPAHLAAGLSTLMSSLFWFVSISILPFKLIDWLEENDGWLDWLPEGGWFWIGAAIMFVIVRIAF